MTSPKIIMLCPRCGSDAVHATGWLSWDVNQQQWNALGLYDNGACCLSCGAEEVEPLPCDEEPEPFIKAYLAGWRRGGDNGGFWYDGKLFESWKAAASADEAATYGSAREVCENEELDP